MNSFFLSVSFPRTRWQANCIFRSGATLKCNETPYPTNGSDKNPAMGTFNISNLCQILHSFPYFFITLFPTYFYDRSRMTGRYLIPFYKKLFYVSAHTCPFRRLRRHLPRSRGRLKTCILSFYGNNQVIHFKKL